MKSTNPTLVPVLLALGLAVPATGLAAEHSPQLLLMTRLIDRVPSKAQLVSAGAGEDGAALLAIARDADLPRYPRVRAASLLAHFDTPQTKAGLAALIDDPKVGDREVKIQALAALVHLDKARTFDRLSRLSADPDPELRAAALRNLGRIEHPGVAAVLTARQRAEPQRWVRDLAERLATRR